ncbi:MAG: TonB-dependent receptor plug domain-containing protein, partial [Ginsengibacter sp.]
MKMIFFLMIAACLQVSAKSYSQKITISEKNVSIERVFKEIEKQSGYVFWYESDLLNPDLKISISVENVGIDQVLNVCLKGQPLTYTILGKTIVLKSKPDVLVPLIETIVEMPPPITVKGKVTDDNGNAVSGVSVLIKGNTNGTQTDANGNYSISDVPDNAILVFTSVGHYTKEIPVGNIRIINITLTIKVEGLEETVVVAYGKSKVRDVTGSISHLGTQEIKNAPMGSTISSMLQGKAAGVNVVIQSASPTSPISVIIRGASSLTGDNQPLWVIDGVPDYAVSTTQVLNSTNSIHGNDQSATTTGSIYNTLYNLNLSDVESIDILKDASATALYGSRAANGVVIVTTKKGRAGMAPIMEFSAKFGYLKQDFNGFDLMNTSEYMNAADKGAREEA